MSSSPANCDLMRSHRVIPLLVQLLHGPPSSGPQTAATQQVKTQDGASAPLKHPREVRQRVAKSLHNMVHAHPTDKQCKREAKVLRLLETLRMYSGVVKHSFKTSKTWFYKLPAAIFPIFYQKKIILMLLILSGAHNCNKLGSCPG